MSIETVVWRKIFGPLCLHPKCVPCCWDCENLDNCAKFWPERQWCQKVDKAKWCSAALEFLGKKLPKEELEKWSWRQR